MPSPDGNTFTAELKEALHDADFNVVDVDFDREVGFPQLLVSYAGLDRERANFGERVPRVEIRVATGWRQDISSDLMEFSEDVANRVFDALNRVPSVLVFDNLGLTLFEPIDGGLAEYIGLLFTAQRSGGVRR